MIEINLLPEEKRKKTNELLKFDIDFEIGKIAPIVGGAAAGILILLVILLFIGSSVRTRQIKRLILREQEMFPQKSDVDKVNNDISLLKTKMAVLDKITKRDFSWARKLNELSDMALPGIWFTRIHTDVDNNFVIEGSVISKKEEAMASVGKFMKNIREHSSFFKDFSNIRLESVQRKSTETKDVVDFKIVLYFKNHGS